MTTRACDAHLALLTLTAEDAYQAALRGAQGPILSPAPDPRLSPDWTVCGVLTAQDAVLRKFLRLDVRRTFYGWLLKATSDPTRFLVTIRGTQSVTEWWDDAHVLPATAHPAAGNVESGFWSLYQSMRYLPAGATQELPLVSALTATVGEGTLTVCGHSLGSALAELLTFDLADQNRLSRRVAGRYFASPRIGDQAFSGAFDGQVVDYTSIIFDRDLVPTLPPGYSPLPRLLPLTEADAPFTVGDSIFCRHHLATYRALLLERIPDSSDYLAIDRPYLGCFTENPARKPRPSGREGSAAPVC